MIQPVHRTRIAKRLIKHSKWEELAQRDRRGTASGTINKLIRLKQGLRILSNANKRLKAKNRERGIDCIQLVKILAQNASIATSFDAGIDSQPRT